jgi:tetratricopeptide (TPR) repeat protein
VIEAAPAWAEARNLLGITLEGLGRLEEALDAYALAVQLDPSFLDAQENLSDAEAEWLRERRGAREEEAPPAPVPGEHLVTVAAFSYPIQAYLARTMLEWEGIQAFVADEHVVTANWLYSNLVGGVKLQVEESDRAAAVEILEQEAASKEEGEADASEPHCPQCNSSDVSFELFHWRLLFASWLLLGFPLPFVKRKWVCGACKHSWGVEDDDSPHTE